MYSYHHQKIICRHCYFDFFPLNRNKQENHNRKNQNGLFGKNETFSFTKSHFRDAQYYIVLVHILNRAVYCK